MWKRIYQWPEKVHVVAEHLSFGANFDVKRNFLRDLKVMMKVNYVCGRRIIGKVITHVRGYQSIVKYTFKKK